VSDTNIINPERHEILLKELLLNGGAPTYDQIQAQASKLIGSCAINKLLEINIAKPVDK
jgi:hypothetical protein